MDEHGELSLTERIYITFSEPGSNFTHHKPSQRPPNSLDLPDLIFKTFVKFGLTH